VAEEDTAHSMRLARELWRSKGDANTSKKDRKTKRKTIAGTVDGRRLKATGRTEQFNFRARSEVKAKAHEAAEKAGITIAEWMELAVEAYLAQKDQEQASA
jgi:hypothetical protein